MVIISELEGKYVLDIAPEKRMNGVFCEAFFTKILFFI